MAQMIEIPVSEYKELIKSSNTLNVIESAFVNGKVDSYQWEDVLNVLFCKKHNEEE